MKDSEIIKKMMDLFDSVQNVIRKSYPNLTEEEVFTKTSEIMNYKFFGKGA